MQKNRLPLFLGAMLMIVQPSMAQLLASASTGVGKLQISKEQTSKKNLKEMLLDMKRHYKINILFFDKNVEGFWIETNRIALTDKLEQNLDKLLKGLSLSYTKVSEDSYVISPSTSKKNALSELKTTTNTSEIKNNIDNVVIEQTVIGKVVDTDGQPLVGVTVSVKGTTRGTTTDKNGQFKVNVPNENSFLVFSFIGYKKYETRVGKQTTINVSLAEDNTALAEVQVISTGYGSVSKKDHTGATGSVKMADFEKAPVRSFDEALAGRLAGVQVTSPDGQPGANADIVIRGAGTLTGSPSPLFVIDGFIQESANYNSLNPSDIESIEVLKDASATAIYGARGANGVIIVTTKRGKSEKTTITYNGSVGMQQIAKKMSLLNAYEFVRLQSEINPTFAAANYFTDGKTLESYRDIKGIDWQDKMYNDAPFQNHALSLAGKSGKTSYLLSGNFTDQSGLIVNSGFNRYQGRFALDQQVNSKLKIGITSNYGVTTSYGNIVSTQTVSGNSGSVNDQNFNLIYNIWSFRPVSGTMSEAELENITEDLSSTNSDQDRFNPYVQATNELNQTQSVAFSSNGYMDYQLNKYFKLRITGGITSTSDEQLRFYNSNTKTGSPLTFRGSTNGPNGSVVNAGTFNYQNENLLFYDRKIGKVHTIGLLTGFTIQKNTSKRRSFSALQVPNETLGINGLDEGTPFLVGSSSSLNTMMSYLMRVNYSYKSKYSLTASMRADGSSKFRPENQWGYFPSGAVAWRFGEEAFMKKFRNVLSEGKLRASYGITGNNRVSDFATYASITTPFNSRYAFNNSAIIGSAPATIENPDLTWETSSMLDVGLELGFVNNRINLELDYYKKKTYDLLLNSTISSTTGFSSMTRNVGDVMNEGLEFTLNSLNIKKKNFSWSTNFNISFNRNRVLRLSSNENSMLSSVSGSFSGNLSGYNSHIAAIGGPVAQFYGFVSDGLYRMSDFYVSQNGSNTLYTLKDGVPYYGTRSTIQPGDVKLKDLNGDGIINANDNTVIGSPFPVHLGGFSNAFTYKGFDLNVFFQWSFGNDVMNANNIMMLGNTTGDDRGLGMNMFAAYADHWTLTSQDAEYPRVKAGAFGLRAYASRFVEDGSFIRLKTISFGYNVPAKLLKKANITALRLYTSAQNIKTWTNYTGPDPEVSTKNASALTSGFDFSPYPRAKVVVFGLNLTF